MAERSAPLSRTEAPRVGVVGATGLVGRELVTLLAERRFPRRALRLFASPRAGRRRVRCGEAMLEVEPLAPPEADGLRNLDLVFLATPAGVSRRLAPACLGRGAAVVDLSSAFRADDNVPLVVPEVNGARLQHLGMKALDRGSGGSPGSGRAHAGSSWSGRGLVASPNCCVAIMATVLGPLHRAAGLDRVEATTYQAASGGGRAMLESLEREAERWTAHSPGARSDAPPGGPRADLGELLFNVRSHESAEDETGLNGEERKIVGELRRILDAPRLRVTATCVRVPVRRAHAIAVTLTTRRPMGLAGVRELLGRSPGVAVVDRDAGGRSPEPAWVDGRDLVEVGRIRRDPTGPGGRSLHLFLAGDQLRKGSALNAIQIAERLLADSAPRPGRDDAPGLHLYE
ncbi:MAG: Asd/ArgC dimerization domain-containing protein [Candidatus Palauibacterales bacterium]|nr:Asd/ArgC dimerization domain-containing protein [Candidatus Palauibacterales bacterium]